MIREACSSGFLSFLFFDILSISIGYYAPGEPVCELRLSSMIRYYLNLTFRVAKNRLLQALKSNQKKGAVIAKRELKPPKIFFASQ
jgi:hypothetical protein